MVRAKLVPFATRFPTTIGGIHNEMEKMFDVAVHGDSNVSYWTPRTNVIETKSGFEVTIDLPAVRPEDVAVELENSQLSISGKIEAEAETEDKTFHRRERRTGIFCRVLGIPDTVDGDTIHANLENGVLTLILSNSEKLKAKRIHVKTK